MTNCVTVQFSNPHNFSIFTLQSRGTNNKHAALLWEGAAAADLWIGVVFVVGVHQGEGPRQVAVRRHHERADSGKAKSGKRETESPSGSRRTGGRRVGRGRRPFAPSSSPSSPPSGASPSPGGRPLSLPPEI